MALDASETEMCNSANAGEMLLQALDPNPDLASQKLEAIVLRLTRFFGHNNCPDPADLAHEVIRRVSMKLSSGMTVTSPNVESLLFGFANNIRHECWKELKQERAYASQQHSSPPPAASIHSLDARVLLSECERILGEEDMGLLRSYYQEDIKDLSQRLGISPANLALRIHRLKKDLRDKMGWNGPGTKK